MAAFLSTCTALEQQSVMPFLSSEGAKPAEIHRRIKTQYGDPRVSLQEVYGRTKKFKSGVTSVEGALRPDPAHRVVTNENIATAEIFLAFLAIQDMEFECLTHPFYSPLPHSQ